MRLLCRIVSLGKTFGSVKAYQTSSVLYKIVPFNLSDIGEGIREVTVRDWYVKVGDKVSQFENVCLVESDKASVSITSRYDGVVKRLHYDVGDVALVGKPLLDIHVDDSVAAETTQDAPAQDPPPPAKDVPRSQPEKDVEILRPRVESETVGSAETQTPPDHMNHIANKALATPAVRRIAKENSINLSEVKPSGKGGRVMKEDILRHLNEMSSTATKPVKTEKTATFDKELEITGIKKAMVKTMTKSNTIPTFGYCDEIDVTSLIELRKNVKEYAVKKGINITYMPFFIKALSKALEEFPELNASVDENCENITFKSQHNIGIAMDTEKGLIVPNIKNVQALSVLEIGLELNRLLELGRSLRLGPADMSGGTITISNIGIIGGTYLRPLVLPPEVCILALGKASSVPKFNDKDEIVKRYVLNASWAADHRVIDGATLANFSNAWKEYIENPNFLLMNL